MHIVLDEGGIELYCSDALEALKTLPTASVDALITDPPAGISFMNATWDNNKGGRDKWVSWLTEIMIEARRVLKPGHYGLVWAIPRTSHWTATALEDAGFEIKDRISHIFGTGFPKYKYALKPAVEDWWLVKNPGTAQPLNVEDLRVGTQEDTQEHWTQMGAGRSTGTVYGTHKRSNTPLPNGRHPAHLVLSHSEDCTDDTCIEGCAIRTLGEQSGELKAGTAVNRNREKFTPGNVYSINSRHTGKDETYADTGTAARFFTQFPPEECIPFNYIPKASKKEKNAGCDDLPLVEHHSTNRTDVVQCVCGSKSLAYWPMCTQCGGDMRLGVRVKRQGLQARNHHKTVKSIALMQWLATLITPPNGIILDPFCGSGSTGVAAVKLDHSFIGIDAEQEYIDIARARINHALKERN